MDYKRKLQVFVSSTFLDLRYERQAAVSAILENGHIPAGMELFAAGNEEQMKVIRRWIDDSDIFLLILGGRYGSIDPASGKSYIHLEYDYASQQGKPLFAIVMTDASREARIRAGQSITELQESSSPDKFVDFKGIVTAKLCKFADDEKDIKLSVWQSIRDLEQRIDFSGWISARALPDTSKILSDVAAAAKHSADLAEKNGQLSAKIEQLTAELRKRQDYDGRTFEDLATALKKETVKLEASASGTAVTADLLLVLNAVASKLAHGVSNAFGCPDSESELFYKVASRLFVYGLTEHAKVPPEASWQRFVLSESGQRFVTELRIRASKTEATAETAPVSPQSGDASKAVSKGSAPDDLASATTVKRSGDHDPLARKRSKHSSRKRSAR